MTWLPLESKMFTSVAHDANKQILYLRFQSGDVYRYFDFPDDDYLTFLSAEPKYASPSVSLNIRGTTSATNAWPSSAPPDPAGTRYLTVTRQIVKCIIRLDRWDPGCSQATGSPGK